MNRIILIGNGHDLAHGKSTRYTDFLEWYWSGFVKKTANGQSDENANLDGGQVMRFLNYSLEIRDTTYEALKDLSHFDVSNQFLKIISDKSSENWVDLENEYYYILRDLAAGKSSGGYSTKDEIEQLNDDFDTIKSLLEEYLNEVEESYIDRGEEEGGAEKTISSKIVEGISEQVRANIDEKDFSNAIISDDIDGKQPENYLFLTFNYTSTTQNYALFNGRVDPVIHIHGELDNSKNSMIFGYGDELAEDYKMIENLNDNRYLKNVKSIRYLDTDNYRRMLNFVESGHYQIFVMGHSCGNSDRTLLNTLFEHPNCSSIKVFYHEKDDGYDYYSETVRNISRNFTNKALMRDRVVNKEYCRPLCSVKEE